jgi:inorganic pyrophosphatase
MADPTRLSPRNAEDGGTVVVIETPKGSRNKYAFDEEERVFQLKKVLPAGMNFPYDFGFVPSTLAEDGDPLDVLVLMDEPAFPGCRLSCRVVGIIEGKQGKAGRKRSSFERNDRVVCVESGAYSFKRVKHIDDMGGKFEEEIERFFVGYHDMDGETYRILGVHGPGKARKAIKAAMVRFRDARKTQS